MINNSSNIRIKIFCATLSIILLSTTALFAPPTSNTAVAASQSGSTDKSVKQTTSAASNMVPSQLETFTEQTIRDLAVHLPFKNWQGASLDYTPLGPGTHSWLVTVEDGTKPLGYLIITSDDLGGYVLSEYGIGSDLPYSLAPLEDALVAAGILKGKPQKDKAIFSSLPKGSRMEALYSSISPYWKITLKGKAPVYVHAVTYEIVPSPSNAKTPFTPNKKNIKTLTLNSSGSWTAASVITTDGEEDPYQNLMWLSKPTLSIKTRDDLITLLPEGSQKSLVFTADKQNAAFGAPFNLNGWQRWSHKDKLESEVIYVTIPQRNTDLIRFVPADNLIGPGKFREENNPSE